MTSAPGRGSLLRQGILLIGLLLAAAVVAPRAWCQDVSPKTDEATFQAAELNLLRATLKQRNKEVETLKAENAKLADRVGQLEELCRKAGIDLPPSGTASPAPSPAAAKAADPKAQTPPTTITIDGKEIALPPMDLTRPSSQTKPYKPEEDERYLSSPRKGGTTGRVYQAPPPKTIAENRKEWQETIPKMAVGEFGKIAGRSYFGFKILQILGPIDMIIEMNELPGAQQLRIYGLTTKGFTDDQQISVDDPIAIIDTWTYKTAFGGSRTILLAVPLEWVKHGRPGKSAGASGTK